MCVLEAIGSKLVSDYDDLCFLIIMTFEDYERRVAHEFEISKWTKMRIKDRHRAVFTHIGRFGATRSVDLARAIGIRPQPMMKHVHELESLGLISRRPDPTDARAKLIEFTAAGKRLNRHFIEATERVENQYLEILGERKLNQLRSALKILNNVNDKDKGR